MVGYAVDDGGRLIVSAKAYTAKWHNAMRQPRVSLAVADDRRHLVVYGTAEGFDADPERAELTAAVFGALSGSEPPDPSTLGGMLEEQQRTVLRITPTSSFFHE